MVERELVTSAFRLILGREPESEEVVSFHAGLADSETLRHCLLNSFEFGVGNADLLAHLPSIINFRKEWRDNTVKYYGIIHDSGITLENVADAYKKAGLGDNEYTIYHLRRFYELFAYLASQFANAVSEPRLLEIGVAEHTLRFYRRFFDCEIDTICRPTTLGGPSREWATNAGSGNHWEIDLNQLEHHASAIEQVPAAHYDAVICCEVVEHLVRAPRDVIRLALSKLKPDGILYFSTPNFLTPGRVLALYRGNNPAIGFEAYKDNYHAHHHFREYTAAELVEEVSQAGGAIKDVIFSNCWDYPNYNSDEEMMFRSNLVIVAAPPASRTEAPPPMRGTR